jgi:acyl-coenzyme A synthetase/AMP-(fatty) acid ligase
VDKTLAQLYRELAAQQQHWGAAVANATVLATVSHQHIYGLLFKVLWPLASGRAFVSKTYVDVAALLRDASLLAPAIWVASPAQLSRRIESWPWGLGTALRAIFSSGGPLALADATQVQALCGLAPIEIYGSTETGGIAWRQQQNDARWKPLSQVEVEAVDGLLCVRSPWLGEPSYLGQDRVQISDGGKGFQLLGRADNLVKIEEKRISLTQIEKLLENSAHIHQAKALGVKRGRDCVAAIAVLSESGQRTLAAQGKAALVRELRKLLAPDLDGVALPRIWRFVRELPTNQQGKTPRESLMHLLDAPPAPMLPRVESVEIVGSRAKALIQIPADLACLPGHFASAPVVPGVVQIDWAMHYGRELLGISGRFASMEVIKFKQLLVPGERATLELEFIAEKNKLKFRFASEPSAKEKGKEPGKESREYSSGQLCFEHN